MTIANGTHGELRWNGQKIAKVRNVTIDKNRASLETTGVGDLDATYAYGGRSCSGSCTLLYKRDDQGTLDIMNRLLNDGEELDTIELVLYKGSSQGVVSGSALIGSESIGVTVGDNTSVNVSFNISGKPSVTY